MKRFMDRTYYPDGAYGEPKGYENMATRDIVEALYVLERNFGIDYTTTTDMKELWRYPLHAAYSNSVMPDFGDTGKFSGWGWTGKPFQWLSWRMKNPYTAYYTQGENEKHRLEWVNKVLENVNDWSKDPAEDPEAMISPRSGRRKSKLLEGLLAKAALDREAAKDAAASDEGSEKGKGKA